MGRMSTIVSEYATIFTIINRKEVLCTVCSAQLGFRGKYTLERHLKSTRHIEYQNGISHDKFASDLCATFLGANIPFNKLRDPFFCGFLKKYTNQDIPHPSTIRKYYVPKQFDKTINRIKSKLGGNYLWISADETADVKGRCVVNVMVGTLHPENPTISFLVAAKIRSRVTANDITDIIVNSVRNVVGDDCLKVLLFLSDSASRMLQTDKELKKRFPNMLHLPCVVHGMHRITELVREEFPDVNSLISSFKNILLKAPTRLKYKEMCPNIPFPPESVLTRLGDTWLETACFYAQNFPLLKPFVLNLKQDASTVTAVQALIVKENLVEQLEVINKHFSSVTKTIKSLLEKKNLNLTQSLQHLESLFSNLNTIEGSVGEKVRKINAVLQENPDYVLLKEISQNPFTTQNESGYLKYKDLVGHFHYAPVTSCDVERSLSRFKNILTCQRNQFTGNNLEKYIIVNSYYSNIENVLDD